MNITGTGREKVKTVILALLLAASIVQIGILWGDQSHRIPFNSLLGIFMQPFEGNTAKDEASAKEELFMPYRLIVSDGNAGHWIISREDELHAKLWNNAKLVLKQLSGKAPVKTYTDVSDWGEIASKKGVVYEFKDSISKELMAWFLGIKSDIPDIYKFMVVPDSGDNRYIELYVRTSDDEKVFKTEKYLIKKELWEISPDEEMKLLAKLSESERYSQSNYKLFGELDIEGAMPDVPVAVDVPKYRSFKKLVSSIPEIINHIGGEDADEQLAANVLGNRKDSYSRESFSDSAQFKNTDSIYTIYRNGLLDYRYIQSSDSDKGDIDKALINAYQFINRIKQINNVKGDLYISSISSSTANDRYIIKFDYIVNGRPVYFDMQPDNGLVPVTNAITIEANSKRVLRCRWMLRNLSLTDEEQQYNVHFLDIVNNIGALKDIYINDLSIGYVASAEKREEIVPSMVVEKADHGIYIIEMPIKGD